MKSINEVMLLGNLGKPPLLKKANGKSVVLLSVATNKVWKDKKGEKQQTTQWHRVVLWESLADVANRYLAKGSPVLIRGMLNTRSWSDGTETKWVTEVVGFDLILLSAPKEMQHSPDPAGHAEDRHTQDPTEITDDDIPF